MPKIQSMNFIDNSLADDELNNAFSIGHIKFASSNLNGLRELIQETLSFSRTSNNPLPGTQVYENGSARLAIACDKNTERDQNVLATNDVAISEVGFNVSYPLEIIKRVQECGGKIITEPNGDKPGVVEIYPGLRHPLQKFKKREPNLAPDYTDPRLAKSFNVICVDHIAICLPEYEFETIVERYQNSFGLQISHDEYVHTGTTAMNSRVLSDGSGSTRLVFMQPRPAQEQSQIQKFIDNHGGAGIQHIAFQVPDIVSAALRLKEKGIELLPVPDNYYDSLAARIPKMSHKTDTLKSAHTLVDEDNDGLLLQAFTRPLFGGDTIFLELIERQGSNGFGSGNIKALFQAVERDMAAGHTAAAS